MSLRKSQCSSFFSFLGVYDFPQSRALMNSSSVNDSSLAASKCICTMTIVSSCLDEKLWRTEYVCINRVQERLLPFVFWECQSAWDVSWNPQSVLLSVFWAFCFQQVDFLCSDVPHWSYPYWEEFKRVKLGEVKQNLTFMQLEVSFANQLQLKHLEIQLSLMLYLTYQFSCC